MFWHTGLLFSNNASESAHVLRVMCSCAQSDVLMCSE